MFRDAVRQVFEDFDVLLAPASVCPAPGIGRATMEMDGQPVSVRKNLAPTPSRSAISACRWWPRRSTARASRRSALQIIAPAWREDLALAAALRLERAGVVAAHRPPEPSR